MKKFLSLLSSNELLTFAAFYALKEVPKSIFSFLLWRYTNELSVFNEDSAFDRVSEWLNTLEYTKTARKLRLTTNYRGDEGEMLHSPGIGKHLTWFEGRPVIVSRYLSNKSSSWRRGEDITIRMLGPNPIPMRKLLQEIADARKKTGDKTIEVFLHRGGSYWRLACRKTKRTLDSVFLSKDQKDRIVKDLEHFLEAKKWYLDRGIPYRRGLLLFGPPGCGKTSFVMALAGHLQRPIYALNLGSMSGDEALIEAITTVPEYGILLIEDIDVAKASQSRAVSNASVAETVSEQVPEEKKEESKGITLSALLNALDGAFSRDGRILIMTTNHPEKVDPALFRPGRVDIKERIGELGPEEVFLMCEKFLQTKEWAKEVAAGVETPIIPAELQEKLLRLVQEGPPNPKGGQVIDLRTLTITSLGSS